MGYSLLRRDALRTLAAGGAASLAGCLNSDSPGDAPDETLREGITVNVRVSCLVGITLNRGI